MKFTEIEKDILREVASIGAGNATTALSQLINEHIKINMPETIIIDKQKIKEYFDDKKELVVGIDQSFFGDLQGRIFLYFPRDEALRLSSIVLKKPLEEHQNVSDMDESFFKEVTSILATAYLNSLAKICSYQILPSIPHINHDMLSEIVNSLILKDAPKSDLYLFINVLLEIESTNVKGNMLLFFDEDSLNKIITKLNKE